MKVLQINISANYGSTGRIAESIGEYVLRNNDESFIAYGRNLNPSSSTLVKIGSKRDQLIHLIHSRLFDTHGFHSTNSTKRLVEKIKKINPDIIHLHNIHGYYIDVSVLFSYLKKWNKPVLWTLHDCWPFTGHCAYYERIGCTKWKSECYECPLLHLYPASLGNDNSKNNYKRKKAIFNGVSNMTIVTVSKWLEREVRQSFLGAYPIKTIYNGVDRNIFKPQNCSNEKQKIGISHKKIILGVANEWSEGKGLKVFFELSKFIDVDTVIVLIGLNEKQKRNLPSNVIGVSRTQSMDELAKYYAMADVFVTPSVAETFGMVVAEALSCGTPCVVNKSSALPELVDSSVGFVVENKTKYYMDAINTVFRNGKDFYFLATQEKAAIFTKDRQLFEYYELYKKVITKEI